MTLKKGKLDWNGLIMVKYLDNSLKEKYKIKSRYW